MARFEFINPQANNQVTDEPGAPGLGFASQTLYRETNLCYNRVFGILQRAYADQVLEGPDCRFIVHRSRVS